MTKGGRIRDEDVEEIRRRANIVEIASDYMQVKRAGGGRFKALCPFHAEKTPSLSLEPVKGFFHCFGCSEGGDVFSLVMKLESLSFVEAVERLARRTGVDLRYEQLSASDRTALKRRLRLVDAHRAAADFYHETLKRAPEAAPARAYLLERRGFTKETLEAFTVGFSPPKGNECSAHLATKGFTETEIVEAGLGARREGGVLVDRFRGRVMFPIFDVTGDPVGFGARRLRDDDDGPKYLNSAESPIYHKSKLLYALSSAKNDVVKGARALIVEGYTDVIALHQAGIRDAVATCGTALGLEHLRALQRFTQQVVLSLDSDAAGGAAAERTYEQLMGDVQTMGLSLRVVLMPPGDDPADSVARLGSEGFGALVAGSVPLLEFVLRRESARYDVSDPDQQARALASCVQVLAKTEKLEMQDEYARRLSSWLKIDAQIVHFELDKVRRTGAMPTAAATGATLKRSSGQVRVEKEALKLAIQHPPMVKPFLEDIPADDFSIPSHRAIWAVLSSGADPAIVPESLPDDVARRVYMELAVQEPTGDISERLVAEIFGRLKEFALSRQIDEAKTRLQRLNPENEREEYYRLFADLVDLERRKRRLTEAEEEDR